MDTARCALLLYGALSVKACFPLDITQEATPRIKAGPISGGVCASTRTGTISVEIFLKTLNSRLSFSASDACRVPFLAELGDGTPVQS